jgi:CO/xanthine dehydrogenase Mo-binding subunit
MCNCFMSFVELETDTETGESRVVRIVNATDIGQIIDPPGLENQMNACWGSAGIDGALMEETILDRKTGNVLNANLVDYCWRPFPEIPDVENVILETPFPSNRFHAIGIAEITNAPGPSAVLMAASNAIGKWLFEYPLTPDRILKVLEEKDAAGKSAG